MIKIEITDPHNLDRRTLQETAKYLMGLAGGQLVIPSDSPTVIKEGVPNFNRSEFEDTNTITSLDNLNPIGKIEDTNVPLNKIEDSIPEPQDIFGKSVPLLEGRTVLTATRNGPVPSVPSEPEPVSVALDTNGLPWDIRIHGRAKLKNKDGSWKYQRNVSKTVINRVENEHRGLMGLPLVELPADLVTLRSVPAVPMMETPATPVPFPPIAPVSNGQDFGALMKQITGAMTNGKIKRDSVSMILAKHGIPSLPVLAARQDLIPQIMLEIQGVIDAAR